MGKGSGSFFFGSFEKFVYFGGVDCRGYVVVSFVFFIFLFLWKMLCLVSGIVGLVGYDFCFRSW